jgi:hypothetical protein
VLVLPALTSPYRPSQGRVGRVARVGKDRPRMIRSWVFALGNLLARPKSETRVKRTPGDVSLTAQTNSIPAGDTRPVDTGWRDPPPILRRFWLASAIADVDKKPGGA